MNPTNETRQFTTAMDAALTLKRQNKAATLRFPSDDEYKARQRAIKTIQHRLGPDSTKTEVNGLEEADLALFNKIRVDQDGPEFDEAEASILIGRLLTADVEDESEREGESLIVHLTVFGGIKTTHTVRIPKEKELRRYRRYAYSLIDRRHGRQELKTNIDEVTAFYDLLHQEHAGYAGDVPACHKQAVIMELTAALESFEAEDDPANF